MRVSDGTLRLRAPSLPARRQEPQQKPVMRRQAPTWVGRLFGRREITTYHRCLAIHIHYAGPHSALS